MTAPTSPRTITVISPEPIFFVTNQLHVGGFHHCISGFNGANQAFRFNQS
ncbi:hypothetical protein [Klebsiella pneumoniae IS53]|nr:hypothetical protein [Klebsiella pneumoniae IS53]